MLCVSCAIRASQTGVHFLPPPFPPPEKIIKPKGFRVFSGGINGIIGQKWVKHYPEWRRGALVWKWLKLPIQILRQKY